MRPKRRGYSFVWGGKGNYIASLKQEEKMGKCIEIKAGNYFLEKVMKPIRCKQDGILLLLETLKLFDNNLEEKPQAGAGRVIVYIDKMSRVFYETEKKYFSIMFPFSLEKRGERYRIYDSLTDLEIDDKMISLLISIFKKDGVLEYSLEKAMDFIIESANEYGYKNIDDIWRLMFKLWYMEEGYIRYDYDAKYQNGDKHPLHHLDINYSSGGTYKLGLKGKLSAEDFKDMLDTGTDCAYLSLK